MLLLAHHKEPNGGKTGVGHGADPDRWVGSEDPISRVFDCRSARSGDIGSLSA